VTGFVKLKTIAQQDLEQKNLSIHIVILSNNVKEDIKEDHAKEEDHCNTEEEDHCKEGKSE
jgi:hypothetical protein